ncbi:MAG: Heterodimeric efflux ABC transporter, permease/ATP-binding subunit 1 / Heterodimeric efflux ABC transporter, permease/ATP-binding subunit 2 [uncultured Acidimicrobiales bacterium]|uniref:Heterodimeric efflux ABC transporter, permease/ATP-binding subunit 1 / Heterodimeric efflux ABC transporter, permease/ATP-binding subunit 2 n=1 Tax=uncultured Acidimicrobiales bacterium TaxID=310071 RepID=A0A6J4HD80_9ACTN|nr:MAG: Heterodimeric efflux ABC transporter, permease/ATP-binding subunit 1 / Heterodimeric efflux ABC transporter, permease/ATP-binding subunit 2 [uncultured Acidimicrobiales bacterium]
MGWVRQLLRWLAPHKLNVGIAFAAGLLGTGVAGLTPLVQKVVVDDVTRRTGDAIAPWLLLLVVAGFARFGLAYVRRFFGGRVAADVQYDLRTALFRHVQRLDVASHDQLQTGQLVARASTDVSSLHHLLSFLPLVLGNVLLFFIALGVMVRLSPLLTLVVFAVVPLMALATARVRRTIFPASWDASQQSGVVAGIVEESVTGVRVVKGFGQERRELARLSQGAADLLASRTRLVRLQARFAPTLQVIPTLAQVAVLAVGGWLTIRGRITLGTFLAFNVYVTSLVGPVRTASFLVAFSQQVKASIQRLSEVLDANPQVTEQAGAGVLTTGAGAIELEDVTFGYTTSEPVLESFSLRVEPGETVALVGTSGSGKSTVALLLPRFYDVHAGAVRIGGTDVREVTLESLRRRIGVVFEEPFLFSDTIRANIAYGRPDASQVEVEVAARAAEAHGFISALADGYDSVVGEQGLTLSGGQRQRVALARALLTDPQVLILDDAMSAVDSRVEEEILGTLSRLLAGRTTLLVAHRRSTLRLADRIAVVDQGRVVAIGTAAELEATSPLYRALLSGPDEEVELAADVEASEAATGGATALWDGQPTPSLWGEREVSAAEALAAAGRLRKPDPAATVRAGGHGGGGGGSIRGTGPMAASMVATPELLAAVEALPPADDRPDVGLDELDVAEPSFSFWRFVRRWRRLLGLGVALVVVDSVTNLLGPTVVRYGVDNGVEPGRTAMLWAATALALLVAMASWGNAVIEQLVTGSTAEKVLYALRVRVFAHLQRLSLDYYDREMGGRVMTRMTTDVDAMQQLLATGLVQAVVSGVTCGGVAVALVLMSPPLALATAAIVPPLAVATWLYRRRAHDAYDRARERVAEVNADFQENLSGFRVAQAYSREDRNEDRFAGLADGYRRARVDAQRLVALYFPFVEMLSELANALVLGAGAVFVTRGTTSTGELIAFLLYLNLFFAPIQQLSSVFDTWQQARISIGRIEGLLAVPSGTPAAQDPVDPGRLTGRLEMVGVRFRYAGAADEALQGVDLTIEPGQTVAFVGETGAGKSTVLKLVARFYDVTDGAVLADGVDVRHLDLAAFRQQLGVVPQEPFLFAGTIRDNIAYGRPEASDAEVEAAARAVGAHQVVASLPGGYRHVVGERGRSLSAGQRQLIALARALLPNPPILLLDEATANLDLATEARVSEGMGVAARGRTTLLIAHRLQTAAGADRIVVVDAGRVAESGTHAELLARGGRYAELWRAFAGADAGALA